MDLLSKILHRRKPVADFALAKRVCGGRVAATAENPVEVMGLKHTVAPWWRTKPVPAPQINGDALRALAKKFKQQHPAYDVASQGYQFLMREAANADLRAQGFIASGEEIRIR